MCPPLNVPALPPLPAPAAPAVEESITEDVRCDTPDCLLLRYRPPPPACWLTPTARHPPDSGVRDEKGKKKKDKSKKDKNKKDKNKKDKKKKEKSKKKDEN